MFLMFDILSFLQHVKHIVTFFLRTFVFHHICCLQFSLCCVLSLGVFLCSFLMLCAQSWIGVLSLGVVCSFLMLCAQSWCCVLSLDAVCSVLVLCAQSWCCMFILDAVCSVLVLRAQSWCCVLSLASTIKTR